MHLDLSLDIERAFMSFIYLQPLKDLPINKRSDLKAPEKFSSLSV